MGLVVHGDFFGLARPRNAEMQRSVCDVAFEDDLEESEPVTSDAGVSKSPAGVCKFDDALSTSFDFEISTSGEIETAKTNFKCRVFSLKINRLILRGRLVQSEERSLSNPVIPVGFSSR